MAVRAAGSLGTVAVVLLSAAMLPFASRVGATSPSCPEDGTGLAYMNAVYRASDVSGTPTRGPKLPTITSRQTRTYGAIGSCVGTAAEGFDGGEIIVGASIALRGWAGMQPYAKIMRHTIEIFLDWLNFERHVWQHNVTGGLMVGGKRYSMRFVWNDDQQTASEAAVSIAHSVRRHGAHFAWGGYGSTMSRLQAEQTELDGVLLMAPIGASPGIFANRSLTFGGLPPDYTYIQNAVRAVAQVANGAGETPAAGSLKVGLLYQTVLHEMCSPIAELAISLGMTVANQSWRHTNGLPRYPDGDTVNAVLQRFRLDGVNFVVGCTYHDGGEAVIEGLERLDYSVVASAFTSTVDISTFQMRVDAGWWQGEYALGVSPWHKSLTRRGAFSGMTSADYLQRYWVYSGGEKPSYHGPASFAAACALAAAIEQADTLNAGSVAASLRDLNLGEFGFHSPMNFGGAHGQNRPEMLVLQFPPSSHDLTIVYPDGAAAGSLYFPTPPWGKRRCVALGSGVLYSPTARENIEQIVESECSGHGVCEFARQHAGHQVFECVCSPGWSGINCEQPVVSLNVSVALLFPSDYNGTEARQRQAAELAIEHINSAGFLPTINLQPVVVDTGLLRASNKVADVALLDQQVAEIERELEVNEITVAVGAGYSSDVFALAPLMGNVLLFSPSATHSSLSNISSFPTFGRVLMPDNRQGNALADLVQFGQGQFDWGKIGIIACSDVYCRGLVEEARRGLTEVGITDVHVFDHIRVEENLSSEVRRILSELIAWLEDCTSTTEDSAAVILLLTHRAEGEMMLELASDNQLPVSFLGSEAIGSSSLGTAAAQSAVMALRPGGTDPAHALHKFMAARLPSVAEDAFALRAFDAVYVIAHAMKVALQTGGDVRNVTDLALAAQTIAPFEGTSGDVRLDSNLDRRGIYDVTTPVLSSTHHITVTKTVGSWNANDRSIRLTLDPVDRNRLVKEPVCGDVPLLEDYSVVGTVVGISVAGSVLLIAVYFFTRQRSRRFSDWQKPYFEIDGRRYRVEKHSLLSALKKAFNNPVTISVEAADITAKSMWKPMHTKKKDLVTVTFIGCEHYKTHIKKAIEPLEKEHIKEEHYKTHIKKAIELLEKEHIKEAIELLEKEETANGQLRVALIELLKKEHIKEAIKLLEKEETANGQLRVAQVRDHGLLESNKDSIFMKGGTDALSKTGSKTLKQTVSKTLKPLDDRWVYLILGFVFPLKFPNDSEYSEFLKLLQSDEARLKEKAQAERFEVAAAVVTRRTREPLHHYLPDIAGTSDSVTEVKRLLRQIAELQRKLQEIGLSHTALKLEHFDIDHHSDAEQGAKTEPGVELIGLGWDTLIPIDATQNGTARMSPELAENTLAKRQVLIRYVMQQHEASVAADAAEVNKDTQRVALLDELRGLKLRDLRRRAKEAGMSAAEMEEAMENELQTSDLEPENELQTSEPEHVWGFGLLVYQACTSGGMNFFYVDNNGDFIDDKDMRTLAFRWDQVKLHKLGAVVWPEARELVLGCCLQSREQSVKRYKLKDVLKHPFLKDDSIDEDTAVKDGCAGEAVQHGPTENLMSAYVQQQAKDLTLAITSDDPKAVKELFDRGGVHLNMLDNSIPGSTATPLMKSAFAGTVEVTRILLSEIADSWPLEVRKEYLDQQTSLGFTAYMIACTCGHEEIAGMLKEKGCSTDIVTISGKTGEALLRAYHAEHEQSLLTPYKHAYKLHLTCDSVESYLSLVEKMLDPDVAAGIKLWNGKLAVSHLGREQMAQLEATIDALQPKSSDVALHFTDFASCSLILHTKGIRASSVGQLGGGVSLCLQSLVDCKWGGNWEDFCVYVGRALWGSKWYEVQPGEAWPDLEEQMKARDLDGNPSLAREHWGECSSKLETVLLVTLPAENNRNPARVLPGRDDVYIIPRSDCTRGTDGDSNVYYSSQNIKACLILKPPTSRVYRKPPTSRVYRVVDRVQCCAKFDQKGTSMVDLQLSPLTDGNATVGYVAEPDVFPPKITEFTMTLAQPIESNAIVEIMHRSPLCPTFSSQQLWLENVGRFTPDEMEAGVREVEQLLTQAYTMAYYYTTIENANAICGRGISTAVVDGRFCGFTVCLLPPSAKELKWQSNAAGGFKQRVAKLLDMDATDVHAVVLLGVPTCAVEQAGCPGVFTLKEHVDSLTFLQKVEGASVVYSKAHVAKIWTLEATALSDARQELIVMRSGKELPDDLVGKSEDQIEHKIKQLLAKESATEPKHWHNLRQALAQLEAKDKELASVVAAKDEELASVRTVKDEELQRLRAQLERLEGEPPQRVHQES